jgi:hypothetical protein
LARVLTCVLVRPAKLFSLTLTLDAVHTMNSSSSNTQPSPLNPALESSLAEVELTLSALGDALRARDAAAIDLNATSLHGALARAVNHFAQAARSGPIPPALRSRLVRASGQVAAQRESLARATAALDRAIDVLIPSSAPALYSAYGAAQRSVRGGVIQA